MNKRKLWLIITWWVLLGLLHVGLLVTSGFFIVKFLLLAIKFMEKSIQ